MIEGSEKKFFLSKEVIRELIPHSLGCLATDRIMVDGMDVGYMYREGQRHPADSGWCFFAGDEDEDYTNDPTKAGIYRVNTIANYDAAIIPYLETEAPCAFERIPGTNQFSRVEDPPTE